MCECEWRELHHHGRLVGLLPTPPRPAPLGPYQTVSVSVGHVSTGLLGWPRLPLRTCLAALSEPAERPERRPGRVAPRFGLIIAEDEACPRMHWARGGTIRSNKSDEAPQRTARIKDPIVHTMHSGNTREREDLGSRGWGAGDYFQWRMHLCTCA